MDVRQPLQRGEVWHVPGVDGVGSMQLGVDGGPFTFECILFGTAAAVHVWHGSLGLLAMGDIISIVDDWGTTYTRALLQDVGPIIKTARVNNDGLGDCRGATYVAGVFVDRGS